MLLNYNFLIYRACLRYNKVRYLWYRIYFYYIEKAQRLSYLSIYVKPRNIFQSLLAENNLSDLAY